MKRSAKNSPPPAAAAPAFPPAWETLCALQAARSVEALAQALAEAAGAGRPPAGFVLTLQVAGHAERYRARAGKLLHEAEAAAAVCCAADAPGPQMERRGRRLVIRDGDEFARLQLELDCPAGGEAAAAALAQFAFAQLRLLLRIRHFEAEAVKDDLTSAYNQNFLKKVLRDEIARYRRSPIPFAVIFIDLDNLKDINERHCHLIGSQVLKEVASIFLGAVRKTDLVARFGGDEFVVVLLHSGVEQALQVSQRIRQTLNAAVLCRGEGLAVRITASFGISAMSARAQTPEDLIREADEAMFQVKGSGKNAIRTFQGD